jgi:hypothetical protein
MRVRFQVLQETRVDLRRVLRSDGWVLDGRQGDIVAVHPDDYDASAVRARLLRLGLLTIWCVRIEFWPDAGN